MNPHVGLAWSAAVVVAGSVVSWLLLRSRRNPREKERQRRELVRLQGRVIEGYVTGCEDGVIFYSYHWRGVRYEASQDLSDIPEAVRLLDDFSGPVTVKFLGSRPSNSIVASETWIGVPSVRKGHLI